jgi:hypothetical protein
MPSDLEAIFRRDLERLPGLADDQLLPSPRRAGPLVSLGLATAVIAMALAVVVVAISLRAIRDAQGTGDVGSRGESYFVVADASASPSASAIVTSGLPVCPTGQSPVLDIQFPPPPGESPGTGSPSAEAAFVRAFPGTKSWAGFRPFGQGRGAPVWIVAGGETFVAEVHGLPEGNNWFAYRARFVGCRPLLIQSSPRP